MEKSRIDTLTSLRFFMIFIIAFSHVYFLGGEDEVGRFLHVHVQNPSLPVEFFFVMSGFGLTYQSLIKGKVSIEGNYSLFKGIRFGINRMQKLYWLYVVTMAAMLPLGALWKNWDLNNWAQSIAYSLKEFFADLTLTQSLYGISDIANELNGPCWFISVLFILYCFYPLLEKLNHKIIKRSRISILLMLIFVEVISYVVLVPLSFLKDNSIFDYLAYGSPFSRIFSLFSGILICDLYYKNRKRTKKNTIKEVVIIFIALFWIYNMRVYFDPQENFYVRYPIVAIINNLISIGLVYVFSFEKGMVSKLLLNKTLVSLGACAMYIYLLHYPVIYNVYCVINQLLPMIMIVKVLTTLLIIIITGLLSFLVWKYNKRILNYLSI